MQTKKFRNYGFVALLSLVALAGCDKVMAKPTGYDDGKIMTTTNYNEEIYNNLISIVYDGIHDGDLSSKVLDKVLYQYSISMFGAYDDKVEGRDTEATTLKAAYEDASALGSNYSVVNAFINAHKAYWTTNSDGKRINDAGEEVADDATPSDSERSRVIERWNNIEDRIAKKMYKDISSGSYSDRNLFYEDVYLMNLRNTLNKVAYPYATGVQLCQGVLLDPAVEEEDVFYDEVTHEGFLHRENYQSDSFNYIEESIVPKIYNELLVEQYILDNQYNTLGRSYARKVNIVSIKVNNEYPLAARYLVNEFVDKYISGTDAKPNATTVADSTNKVDLDTLKMLSNAWKGVYTSLTTEEKALLDNCGGFEFNATDNYYYGTEYGDMMEDYAKIALDPYETDSDIESSFTNSGKYTKEVGKIIKTRETLLKDHTENGWYIKNGGLSDLPSAIRSRLFNVGVANALSEEADTSAQDRWQYENGEWAYKKPTKESAYVALINGAYYLKNETTEAGEIDKDMLYFDKDSSTYYIVQIEEAANSTKLSKINDNSYAEKRGDDVMEKFVNEICEIVANNESYQTLSTKHWLEEAGILYHDQVVYDYFKNNYPELFDDDKQSKQ